MVRAPTHWWGDVGKGCRNPVTVSWQRERSIEGGLIDLRVPCRKCITCLKRRSREWGTRADKERFKAERTWMVSLTYREGEIPLDGGRHEVTMWLQRLKRAFPGVRYLVVTERGKKNGRLHHHALVHASGQLTWRRLAALWTNGFARYNLARNEGAGRYIAKYITKAEGARVRASRGYGALSADTPWLDREYVRPCEERSGPLGEARGRGVVLLIISPGSGFPGDRELTSGLITALNIEETWEGPS